MPYSRVYFLPISIQHLVLDVFPSPMLLPSSGCLGTKYPGHVAALTNIRQRFLFWIVPGASIIFLDLYGVGLGWGDKVLVNLLTR